MTPDEFTISEHFLDVGNGHEIYVHDWGNKAARTPIVFLHGGPAAGCKDRHKQKFDPITQRVIFHDQRGAGRSLPYGSLTANTTEYLVDDIEKIAKHLHLEHFIISAGSWGSCLALNYALKHPTRITAMVLQGIFTGRPSEVDFLGRGDFRRFFPEVWQKLSDATPQHHQANPQAYHLARIRDKDDNKALESAQLVGYVEGSLARLDDRFAPEPLNLSTENSAAVLAQARLEAHYVAHNFFMADSYILKNAHTLTMPVWIVQGRYDFITPPITAYELHAKLPDSRLVWTIAGHVGSDRANTDVERCLLAELTRA